MAIGSRVNIVALHAPVEPVAIGVSVGLEVVRHRRRGNRRFMLIGTVRSLILSFV